MPQEKRGRAACEFDDARLPDGVSIGGFCLAQGLVRRGLFDFLPIRCVHRSMPCPPQHAGAKRPFQAVLLGVRKNSPPLLVKYCADEAGRRQALHLPDMRKAYVLPQDVVAWKPEPSKIHIPRSAKTRAQKVCSEEEARLANMPKKKRRAGRRVTFADLPPPIRPPQESES